MMKCVALLVLLLLTMARAEQQLYGNYSSLAGTGKGNDILIAGDSWGTVIAGGSFIGASFFDRKLKEHKCSVGKTTNIAIPGSTAQEWSTSYLKKLVEQAPAHDFLWLTMMGNDALYETQDCAKTGKSAEECGDQLYAEVKPKTEAILDAVHKAAPSLKVVGFGYDTMFGGLGCSLMARLMFPQCWKGKNETATRCFNTQFIRIQALWEELAKTRADWLTIPNLLGTTQVAAGNTKASIGKPDMDSMGPRQYWPDFEACIHPSVTGGDKSGAMVIMEEFYNQFWSRELAC